MTILKIKPEYFFTAVFFLIYFAIPSSLHSQTESEIELFESNQDQLSSEILDDLEQLQENPINLNKADTEQLEQIPFLTRTTISKIIEERRKNGLYKSMEDFKKRLHISTESWNSIEPYLCLKNRLFEGYSVESRSRFQRKFSNDEDYTIKYQGSAWKFYQRIKFSKTNFFNGAVLIEKDAGETQWNDHLVGYLESKNLYYGINAVIGNFYIKSGQGLIFWSPYGFSKGAYPVSSFRRASSGLRGYKSTDENKFLKGAALSIPLAGLKISLFASNTLHDASLNSDGTVKSILSSGYHRTDFEKKRKDNISEKLIGGRVVIKNRYGEAGLTGYYNNYSSPFKGDPPDKNLFSFCGKKNQVIGADYDFCFSNFNFFGEIAKSKSGGAAFITGCVCDLNKNRLIASYRYFSPKFQNPYGYGFESAQVKNEEGLYFGFSTRLFGSSLSFIFDIYKRPWRTYSIPVSSRGNDLILWFKKRFSHHFCLMIKAKLVKKNIFDKYSTPDNLPAMILKDQIQKNLRFDILTKFKKVKMKTRFEINYIKDTDIEEAWTYSNLKTDETGILFYQDLCIQYIKALKLYLCWTKFETNSYTSRIYVYEYDLPGTFYTSPLYGSGDQLYLLAKIKISEQFSFNIKLRKTVMKKSNRKESSEPLLKKCYIGLQADLGL